uniref:Uncharacterized protein n=1 Tax=Litorilinea aerophila TaxID=1204385 RepID=A0A540VB81_9CHLR
MSFHRSRRLFYVPPISVPGHPAGNRAPGGLRGHCPAGPGAVVQGGGLHGRVQAPGEPALCGRLRGPGEGLFCPGGAGGHH